jgi:hypothetical protein
MIMKKKDGDGWFRPRQGPAVSSPASRDTAYG